MDGTIFFELIIVMVFIAVIVGIVMSVKFLRTVLKEKREKAYIYRDWGIGVAESFANGEPIKLSIEEHLAIREHTPLMSDEELEQKLK